MRRRQFLKIAAVLLISVACSMQPISTVLGGSPMRYTSWKTVCVGRYLVDVPTDVQLTYFTWFNNEPLEKTPGTSADAKKMAEEKVHELKAEPHETKGSLYIQSIPLPNGGMLVHGWSVSFAVRNSEAFLYIPVTTRGKSFVYTYSAKISSKREQKELQELVSFGSSFRPLPEGVIPKETGLCLEDVMLVNLPDSFAECCSIRLDDPQAKGLILSFKVEAALTSFRWLTQRPGWADEECTRLEGSKKCDQLRFGKHPIGPIQGEEICLAGRTYDSRYRTYIFEWNNPGLINSATSPRLTSTLYYRGVPIERSTAPTPFSTDAEALSVWDRFVNSIRVRPVE